MPHHSKINGFDEIVKPVFLPFCYGFAQISLLRRHRLATPGRHLQAMGFKALIDPTCRLPGIKPQNAVFRIVDSLGKMGDEPILPKFPFHRRVLDNLDLAQQRDAVAAQKIADASFRILPEMPGLGGVGPGGHPDRPDSCRLILEITQTRG
jgi:hypothetical protein